MRLLIHTKPLIALACLLFMGLTVSAQNKAALATAQKYLTENIAKYKLTAGDIAELEVTDNYVTKHNGVTHIYFRQKHEGVEVFNGVFNINILPNGEVLNPGNRLVSNLQERINTTTPQISAADAVQALIEHFGVKTPSSYELTEVEKNDKGETIFAHEGIALEPIKAKLVYQPMLNKRVHLAWQVNFYELDAQSWWNARIDALTGKVLDHQNQVIHCSFGRPDDVCAEEHDHHHAHTRSTASAPTMMDVNNGYYVLPLTVESPNHGDHELVVGPANSEASPFGWHDVDGIEGHDFTITRGNNVHAYQDINGSNSSSGDEPDGGDSLLFEFPFDETNIYPFTQVEAATTNLFYWNNLMHDIWYQYGFDEASGNFQENNYEAGGIGGDPVQAECLDGSGTDNANFGTPADGGAPRMQMYYWTSFGSSGPDALVVNEPGSVAGEYPMQIGGFGGALPSNDDPIIAQVVLADDGIDQTSDACEDIINGAELNGKIAMIDRGGCEFGFKALAAENAGAIAVIICNNVPDPATLVMGAGAVGDQVTIPAVMVSLADCNTIKMGLPELEVTLGSDIDPANGPAGIDGDFDNGIIAHEYGHGISIRLVGGPSTGCLGGIEQPGEGWSDWFGMVLTTTPANNADESRGVGTYALNQSTNGQGIRDYPYSRDMAVNPFTYADINSGVSVPHGVGSIWCTMIWDLYWNLIDVYGFDEDLYNGTGGNNIAMQLVIDGLKFTPCSPSFVDCRDAILAADQANYDGANTCLIWETFARRGLGANAIAEGIEDFSLPTLCRDAIGIEKSGPSSADVSDVLTYTLNLINGTDDDLTNVSITDILPEGTSYVEGSFNCGSASVSGNSLSLTMDNFSNNQITPCTYEVQIESGEYTEVIFAEDMESGLDQWEISSSTESENWDLDSNSNSGSFSVFAVDYPFETDQHLVWKDPFLVEGIAPVFAFWHSYDTEANWDGGVVEIKVQGVPVWQDLGPFMTINGYDGPIFVDQGSPSPISDRPAFSGNSNGFIYTQIDMSSFLGQEVQVRFRFVSDYIIGGTGWYVDDVEFYGEVVTIENTACMNDHNGDEVCSTAETIVYGSVVSSTGKEEKNARISLYPNPTRGVFSLLVDVNVSQSATLNIYSVDGQLLRTSAFNTNETQRFDLTSFGSGVYLAEIISGEIQTVRKVVVN